MKRWSELTKEEQQASNAWTNRQVTFCPLTRKPCWEWINPEGPFEPENYRECRFWEGDWETCVFRLIFSEPAAVRLNDRLEGNE